MRYYAAGAATIDAVVTHALFPPELVRTLFEAGIRTVRSSDSVPHPTNAIMLDGILAGALANGSDGGDGHERYRPILRRRPHGDRLLPSFRDTGRASCWSIAGCSRAPRR